MLPTATHSSVSTSIVEQLATMIRTGDYAAGDRLPGERILAKQFQVSRASIREALRTLSTIGLLETRHGLGTFVKDPSSDVIQAALVYHIIADQETL